MIPEQLDKRILIVVAGMSPQVLTETVYTLLHRQPAFRPTEIHLISTGTGASHARLSLLDGDAHFLRLCRDYGLDASVFDASRIHIIQDADGKPLDDIRTPADNEVAADSISDLIRQHTEREDAAVHVSLAGGRKTMGYYAGYALSLFGRDQDRLSHVLVSEGFEGHREFFYPTPRSHAIYRDGSPALDASEAKVTLASIPFVRLRHQLPGKALAKNDHLSGRQGFSETVAAAEWARQPHVITLNLRKLDFRIGDRPLQPEIGTASLVFLSWLAYRHTRSDEEIVRSELDKEAIGKPMGLDFMGFCNRLSERDEELRDATGESTRSLLPEIDKTITPLKKCGFTGHEDLDNRMTALKGKLAGAFGPVIVDRFLPTKSGKKGKSRYGFVDFDERFMVIA